MVIDYLCNKEVYNTLIPTFKEGMEFALSLTDMPPGRYENGEIFAMVQEGTTTFIEKGEFEYHKKYIDVQIVVFGEETVGYDDISRLTPYTEYSEEKDAGFMKGEGQTFLAKEGMFYIMFPHDGHKPCKHLKGEKNYKKIVLKLKA